jgi:hypothetical protein
MNLYLSRPTIMAIVSRARFHSMRKPAVLTHISMRRLHVMAPWWLFGLATTPVPGAVPGTGTLQLIRSTDGGGSFSAPTRVSVDVCPCCRPELKTDGQENWYLAWRDVAPDQERDIVLAAWHDNGATWSEPVFVSHDRWHINGCPDSGPSLALLNDQIFCRLVHSRRPPTEIVLVAFSGPRPSIRSP